MVLNLGPSILKLYELIELQFSCTECETEHEI